MDGYDSIAIDSYRCLKCGECCVEAEELRNHYSATHLRYFPYACGLCHQWFVSRPTGAFHFAQQHQEQPIKLNSNLRPSMETQLDTLMQTSTNTAHSSDRTTSGTECNSSLSYMLPAEETDGKSESVVHSETPSLSLRLDQYQPMSSPAENATCFQNNQWSNFQFEHNTVQPSVVVASSPGEYDNSLQSSFRSRFALPAIECETAAYSEFDSMIASTTTEQLMQVKDEPYSVDEQESSEDCGYPPSSGNNQTARRCESPLYEYGPNTSENGRKRQRLDINADGCSDVRRADEEMYSVRDILKNTPDGVTILERFSATTPWEEQNNIRKKLIAACVDYLMQHCRERNEPNKLEKCQMARSIVDVFPFYKCLSASEFANLGYEHIYDPETNTGFLKDRISYKRSHLGAAKKKPKVSVDTYNRTAVSDLNNDKAELLRQQCANCVPTVGNKAIVKDKMCRLRGFRQKWIKNTANLAIADILRRYPRFVDIPELIIDEGKSVLESEAFLRRDMSQEWLQSAPIIIKHALEAPTIAADALTQLRQLGITADSNLTTMTADVVTVAALFSLAVLCRPQGSQRSSNTKRISIAGAHGLIRYEKMYTKMTDVLLLTRDVKAMCKQPYLLLFTSDGKPSVPLKAFLVIDRTPIPISTDLTMAVQYLFCVHWAFNIDYRDSVLSVYQFLEMLFGVARVTVTKSAAILPTVRELYISVANQMSPGLL